MGQWSALLTRGLAAVSGLVLLALMPVAADAQGFGRLFSTPQERAMLNQARSAHDFTAETPTRQVEEPTTVPEVTLNGLVLRSSGNDASWVNGSQIRGGDATREGIQVEPAPDDGGTVRIVLPGGLEEIRLKPGQKVDIRAGSVWDVYRGSQQAPADVRREGDAASGVIR